MLYMGSGIIRTLWKHFEISDKQLNLDECGIQQFKPNQKYQYTGYQDFVIHYIESGKGTYTVDGDTHYLSKGEGFIVRKGLEVSYQGDSKDPWKYYWVGLSGAYLESYLSKTILKDKAVIQFKKDSRATKMIKEICNNTLNFKDIDVLEYLAQSYQLLFFMFDEFGNKDYHNHSIPDNYALVAYNYIHNNYMHAISIGEVSDYIGISRSHLYREFKKEYKMSPYKFLNDIRMNKASELLLKRSDNIKEIAEEVGYPDQLHFSKNFKKNFGISPTDYRENKNTGEIRNEIK